MSIIQFDWAAISVSWCKRNWGENKMPLRRGGGVNSGGIFSAGRALHHLYPRAFCTLPSFAHIKGPSFTSTIARKNKGLWTVYLAGRKVNLWLWTKMAPLWATKLIKAVIYAYADIICFTNLYQLINFRWKVFISKNWWHTIQIISQISRIPDL